jgi:hypothetical protein
LGAANTLDTFAPVAIAIPVAAPIVAPLLRTVRRLIAGVVDFTRFFTMWKLHKPCHALFDRRSLAGRGLDR